MCTTEDDDDVVIVGEYGVVNDFQVPLGCGMKSRSAVRTNSPPACGCWGQDSKLPSSGGLCGVSTGLRDRPLKEKKRTIQFSSFCRYICTMFEFLSLVYETREV
jgi:hypothetical protein